MQGFIDFWGVQTIVIAVPILGTPIFLYLMFVFFWHRVFPLIPRRQRRDNALPFIQGHGCEALNNQPIEFIGGLINDLLGWFTRNEHEEAILRVLECADCDRVREIVDWVGAANRRRGRRRLRRKFQGPERDRLLARFEACGI